MALPPGVHFQESLDRPLPLSPARPASPPVVAPPPVVASLPVFAPPPSSQLVVVPSRTPSAGSGHTGTPVSDDIPTARPSRPLPRPRIKRLRATSGEGDPPPAAAPVVAPKPVVTPAAPVAPRPTRAAAAATPAAAPVVAAAAPVPGRSSLKRSATPPRPETWATCVRCRSQKKGCTAARDANPPYSACTLCLKSGQPCIRRAKPAGGEYDLFLFLVLTEDCVLQLPNVRAVVKLLRLRVLLPRWPRRSRLSACLPMADILTRLLRFRSVGPPTPVSVTS